MPGVEHGAQRAVDGETEIVGFVDQQRGMLAVNRMVKAGGGDAVRLQRTQTQGFNEVEERGLAAATNRTGQGQPRRHRKSLINESVHDPQRHRDELVRRHIDVALEEMVHEIKRIDVGTGRGIVMPVGPRVR